MVEEACKIPTIGYHKSGFSSLDSDTNLAYSILHMRQSAGTTRHSIDPYWTSFSLPRRSEFFNFRYSPGFSAVFIGICKQTPRKFQLTGILVKMYIFFSQVLVLIIWDLNKRIWWTLINLHSFASFYFGLFRLHHYDTLKIYRHVPAEIPIRSLLNAKCPRYQQYRRRQKVLLGSLVN